MKPRNIRVKAVEGRIARVSPNGVFIPHDRFVVVAATPYVMRLLNAHHDIELEPEKAPEKAKVPPAVPDAQPAMKGA